MKKITAIALALVFALLLPCFVACGEGEGSNTTAGVTTPAAPDGTTAAPADTTGGQVTNADGSCRHAKMGDWVITGNYTCQGLAISTRACAHCDFIQYEYTDDASGNFGDHIVGEEVVASYPGASNLAGFEVKTCTQCQELVRVETAATNTRANILPEHGTHKNKGGSDWGHIGYSGAHGTATIYNGLREATITTDASVFYWNLKDVENRYTPNGVLVADGSDESAKYCALIGIDFAAATSVSGFGMFVENQNEFAFDVLGGTKNADGTTSWRVLTSYDGASYQDYDASTSFALGDFEAADVDCLQIGITTSYSNVVLISEIEIYG